MAKGFLIIVVVFYVVGALAAGGSFVHAHWGSGWSADALFAKAAERAVAWPVRLLDELI